MDCKKIQELIITDYADGETSEALRKGIEEHLISCGRCRAFKASLDKAAIGPFKYVQAEKPPERVWHNIKSTIEREWSVKPAINIFDRLVEFLQPKKTVFAFATAAVIILMVSVFTFARYSGEKAVNSYLQEQADSFYYINENGDSSFTDTGYAGFDTGIEEFFL